MNFWRRNSRTLSYYDGEQVLVPPKFRGIQKIRDVVIPGDHVLKRQCVVTNPFVSGFGRMTPNSQTTEYIECRFVLATHIHAFCCGTSWQLNYFVFRNDRRRQHEHYRYLVAHVDKIIARFYRRRGPQRRRSAARIGTGTCGSGLEVRCPLFASTPTRLSQYPNEMWKRLFAVWHPVAANAPLQRMPRTFDFGCAFIGYSCV